MGPDLAASLSVSHTQTATQNQQGANINTGVVFGDYPMPPVNDPGIQPRAAVDGAVVHWGLVGLGILVLVTLAGSILKRIFSK